MRADDVEVPSQDNPDIYMDVLAADNFLLGSDILASDILDPDLDLLQFSKEQLENIVLAMFVGLRFDTCLGFPHSVLVRLHPSSPDQTLLRCPSAPLASRLKCDTKAGLPHQLAKAARTSLVASCER